MANDGYDRVRLEGIVERNSASLIIGTLCDIYAHLGKSQAWTDIAVKQLTGKGSWQVLGK